MNIHTGEIQHFKDGEPIPKGFVPLKRLADKNCPDCKGVGKFMRKKPGKRGGFYYEPCQCTQ